MKILLGIVLGLASIYLFNIGEQHNTSIYSVVISPITFGLIIFGYPTFFASLIVSAVFLFGISTFYDAFSLVYFVMLLLFNIRGRMRVRYVIYSYCIAQAFNVLTHVSVLNENGYWALAIIKTIMSLLYILLVYVFLNNLINLSKRELFFKKASKTDPLTGINNRRSIDAYIESLNECYGEKFCVFMLDIDNFKYLNDNFGHPFGDKVIKRVAYLVKKNVRENDFVGRYGGEEFIVFINADLQNATKIAEDIRMVIQNSNIKFDSQEVHVTVSIGLSEHADTQSVLETITAADNALYTAKRSGKNKIMILSGSVA
ncbi:GGDEF domain-containing protein [Rahnella aceris]|uniref:GGDEF domain-containing protein n=1 Tax=Rahnella sp. (strain Y9602) TaxID=2703885 RepID=UPI0016014368